MGGIPNSIQNRMHGRNSRHGMNLMHGRNFPLHPESDAWAGSRVLNRMHGRSAHCIQNRMHGRNLVQCGEQTFPINSSPDHNLMFRDGFHDYDNGAVTGCLIGCVPLPPPLNHHHLPLILGVRRARALTEWLRGAIRIGLNSFALAGNHPPSRSPAPFEILRMILPKT